MLPEWFPPSHQESAEHIRAYLVGIRGGAPFLSGADCRLLVDWLDDEVPMPAILCAIDRVSLRRRSKRVRTRLSLNSCKGELNKVLSKGKGLPAFDTEATNNEESPPLNGLALLSHKIISSLNKDKKFVKEQIILAEAIQKISTDDRDHQSIATDAIQLITTFHIDIWQRSIAKHELFTQEAEEELSDLQSLLSAIRWQEAVDEVARDRLRAQFPLLTAQMIWNALNQVLV